MPRDCMDCGLAVDGRGARCTSCRRHTEIVHDPTPSIVLERTGKVRIEWCHGAGPFGNDHQRIPVGIRTAAAFQIAESLGRQLA